jgi:hypothetical protein
MEVPPNIEADPIVLCFPTALACQANPALYRMIPEFPALGAVGRGFAITICMILVIIRMKVLSEALKLALN